MEDHVLVAQAAIDALPVGDEAVVHVRRRDVLTHVDLPRGLAECSRTIRPRGRILVYQMLGELCPTVYLLRKPVG